MTESNRAVNPGESAPGDDFDDAPLDDYAGDIEQYEDGDELVLRRIPRYSRDPFEVLRFDRTQQLIRIFPKQNRSGILEDQFAKIKELQVERPGWNTQNHSAEHGQYKLLYALGLPKGFRTTYEYGLGIKRAYSEFIREIEKRSPCTILRFVISDDEGSDADSRIFRVALSRFDGYCAAADRSRDRGSTAVGRVIDAQRHNAIADLFGLAEVEPKYTRNPVISAFTEEVQTGHVTDAADRAALADELTAVAPAIAQEQPARLVRLREDIELVSLEALIDEFEKGLVGSSLKEDHWQKFFQANHFALQLILRHLRSSNASTPSYKPEISITRVPALLIFYAQTRSREPCR